MKFLDTNVLLEFADHIDKLVPFTISSITYDELEDIKTNKNKTEELRYQCRKAIYWLNTHKNEYSVVVYKTCMEQLIVEKDLPIKPDTKILACASTLNDVTFYTNDRICELIAESCFGLETQAATVFIDSEYLGYLEIPMTDDEMAHFYENLATNTYGLYINQYLIVKNSNNEIVDQYRWDGEKHVSVFKKQLKSLYFEKLKAKDVYQTCAIDSLMSNTVTAISGKAGSGKSLLSLMAAMYLIENGKYDRIVVLFNPTKVRGASDMGYYGGDFIDKALQNSIGHILTTKFGDRYAIDMLMSQNRLKLVSMADCRGMEISDNEILWITEAQNTSIDLIKLCLSRVSSGAKVFIEGDYTSQVDSFAFDGEKNGLKHMINVFKNHEEFGYVQLKNVWRSKIAALCELL